MTEIDDVMDYQWQPEIHAVGVGAYRLTIPLLDDFELFGTQDELWADWRDALRAHLSAYLAVGKIVPVPLNRVYMDFSDGANPGA